MLETWKEDGVMKRPTANHALQGRSGCPATAATIRYAADIDWYRRCRKPSNHE